MNSTHIFAAHAQVPSGTDLYERYKYMTVVVEVKIDSGVIVNCCVPVYCKLHNDFVVAILKGKSLDVDKEAIIEEIDERTHTLSKRALITAIQGLYNQYTMTKCTISRRQKNILRDVKNSTDKT